MKNLRAAVSIGHFLKDVAIMFIGMLVITQHPWAAGVPVWIGYVFLFWGAI